MKTAITTIVMTLALSSSAFAKEYKNVKDCEPYALEVAKGLENLEKVDWNERAIDAQKSAKDDVSGPNTRNEHWLVQAAYEDGMNLTAYEMKINAFRPEGGHRLYCSLIDLEVSEE